MVERVEPEWMSELASLADLEELPSPYWKSDTNRASKKMHAVWPLGTRVCSHPGIGHGGLTVLAMDETFGQMHFNLLSEEMGPGFTVNMNVNFRGPVKAGTSLYVTAEVDKIEGRKAFLKGSVCDAPGGTLLLDATALFTAGISYTVLYDDLPACSEGDPSRAINGNLSEHPLTW
ncbi:hypothetical protein CYMTET_29348 [Cymbomonas tetramitiformis]|uniref:Thioesterase domain-containing protein n=1 Tax=Cymbomonas tetramitiformis TaxID=36881 RepID=A0AAE0FL73_9CHLO|nr:hypothetical protein CYMTET_29348 [Cymbomonas tetramitiformis]